MDVIISFRFEKLKYAQKVSILHCIVIVISSRMNYLMYCLCWNWYRFFSPGFKILACNFIFFWQFLYYSSHPYLSSFGNFILTPLFSLPFLWKKKSYIDNLIVIACRYVAYLLLKPVLSYPIFSGCLWSILSL